MKKIKILCLLLAVVLVLPVLASCNSGKVHATVSVKFVIPGDEEKGEEDVVKFSKVELRVEGTKDNPPTVLQAAEEALNEYEVSYSLTADGHSILEVFGLRGADSADAEKGYYQYWDCFINGERSKDGRQSTTLIYEGDEIVFEWTEGEEARRDTDAIVTTDPSEDTTGYMPSNTTAVNEDDTTVEE